MGQSRVEFPKTEFFQLENLTCGECGMVWDADKHTFWTEIKELGVYCDDCFIPCFFRRDFGAYCDQKKVEYVLMRGVVGKR
jgi:hypothetical protein